IARRCTSGANVRFDVLDIVRADPVTGPYGLVIMCDVVEHIVDLRRPLERLRRCLDPDGFLYVAFPPWRGPYAGHQHHASSIVRFMPYLHALAPRLFLALLHRWESACESWLADERQIIANCLTMSKFERTVRAQGWSIRFMNRFFLRPEFMRMGLPKI